jgi:thermostable 8-oxoguanine DNA glycosylase
MSNIQGISQYESQKQDQICMTLPQYLNHYRDFYQDTVLKLNKPTATQKRERYVFAALSVHRQFAKSVRGFQQFKHCLEPTLKGILQQCSLRNELKDSRIGLYEQAYRALTTYQNLVKIKKKITRDLALRYCRGIGIAKVSFWFALCQPTSEYLCLDTHMLQWLGIKEMKSWKKYLAIETTLGKAAEACGYYPFAYQWAVWEWKQKKGHIDHSFLWNK